MSEGFSVKPLHALRQTLRIAPARNVAEGFYSAITNERVVQLGHDSTEPVVRMVALHEHFHAILNAGTTFGTCLVLAGTLAEAGVAGFTDLTERLIDACTSAHETYATLGSAYAVSKGRTDLRLLDDFPDYRELAEGFKAAVNLPMQSYIEIVCLDACVRAAMQTNLAEHWMALPCEDWLASPLGGVQRPDVRLSLCLQPDLVSILIDAVKSVLCDGEGPLRRLAEPIGPSEEASLLSTVSTTTREKILQAGFDALAKQLGGRGAPTLGFYDNRAVARKLTAKVQAFAGDRLKRNFVVPQNGAEDYISALVDLRRERIVLRPALDPAVFIRYPELGAEFGRVLVRSSVDRRFIQLVSMPRQKCRSLYRPTGGGNVLTRSDTHLTAVRRRLAPAPMYPDGLIVMVVLENPTELSCLAADLGSPRVRAVVSATTYGDDTWREHWLSTAESFVVVVDRDPFALMRSLAEARCFDLAKITFEWGTTDAPTRTEIVVLSDPDDPREAFVTPCCHSACNIDPLSRGIGVQN